MTLRKTPPSFTEGWERIPGASKYEINKDAVARNFASKKEIASSPDAEGNVLIYGDENRLDKFNLRKIADELFPTDQLIKILKEREKEKIEIVELKSGEIVNSLTDEEKNLLSDALETHENQNNKINTPKMATKTKQVKKAALKASTPKKAQSPKVGKKAPETKGKPSKTKELPKVVKALPKSKVNLEDLKITEEEKKIAKLKCMYSIKAWKLHKLGRTPKEIMAILNRQDKYTSTPMAIESYKKNSKLQNRADLVKVV